MSTMMVSVLRSRAYSRLRARFPPGGLFKKKKKTHIPAFVKKMTIYSLYTVQWNKLIHDNKSLSSLHWDVKC